MPLDNADVTEAFRLELRRTAKWCPTAEEVTRLALAFIGKTKSSLPDAEDERRRIVRAPRPGDQKLLEAKLSPEQVEANLRRVSDIFTALNNRLPAVKPAPAITEARRTAVVERAREVTGLSSRRQEIEAKLLRGDYGKFDGANWMEAETK